VARRRDWAAQAPSAADGVQAVVLRAPGSFESPNFDDVLTGLRKGLGQSGSKASRAFQRPDPTPRRSLVGPVQRRGVTRTVGRDLDMGADGAGTALHDGQVDGVSIGVASDDELVLLCQHGHCGCPSIQGDRGRRRAWMTVTCRQHCEGSRPRADRLLIKPRRVGQAGASSSRDRSNARHTQKVASILESRLLLPVSACPNTPDEAPPHSQCSRCCLAATVSGRRRSRRPSRRPR